MNIHNCMNNTEWPKITLVHNPKWLVSNRDFNVVIGYLDDGGLL